MMESKMGDIDNSNSIHIIPNIIALIAGITISMGMVYLPLYGYDLGANEVIVGLIASSQSLTYIFASIFIGRFSDSIGTKKALLFGTGILAVLYALYFVVSNPYLFIPLKAIEGVGFAFIWPSLQAYFGESRKELRVYNIMWCSGVTFSPFIGGFIVQLFGLKYVFIPPMLLLALSFAFGLALSSDNKKEHKSPSRKALNENGRKEIRIFLFPFIYGFILLTISTFFPIYAGSNGIAAIQTGYLLALWNFGRILSFILPDRVHRIFGRSVELLILTIASGFL
jgi:MFS family permease